MTQSGPERSAQLPGYGFVRRRIIVWQWLGIARRRIIRVFGRLNWVVRRWVRRIFDGGRLRIGRLRMGIGWSWFRHEGRLLSKGALSSRRYPSAIESHIRVPVGEECLLPATVCADEYFSLFSKAAVSRLN